MLRSVAVLADVHGVLPALDAVLAEPAVLAADRIVVAGDHLSGPMPVEVLARLRGLGEQVVWVRGNADRELVAMRRGEPVTTEDPVARWAANQLDDDAERFLEDMPERQVVDVEGLGRVLCCHATPRDDEEMVLVDSRLERWAEVLAGIEPDLATLVCGHTHMPFVRLYDRRTVVNPGSVGMPYGPAGACWALLGAGSVSLRRTAYDVEAASATIVAESGYPEAETWVEEFVRTTYGDLEALAAFAPRDGRGVER